MTFPPSQYSAPSSDSPGVPVGILLASTLLTDLVLFPGILKAFKPEWSYGRRVAAGVGVTVATGIAYRLIKAARGEA
jgi:hypothetical protein